MTEHWNSDIFVERLKTGEFDDHLFEALSKLSTAELNEVAKTLMCEEPFRGRVN